MSVGVAVQLAEARDVAERLVHLLAPACRRLEIAGSIRRQKPTVHDIEIVAIPRLDTVASDGLFSEHTDLVTVNRLEERIAELMGRSLYPRAVENRRADGTIDVQEKLGRAYKALVYRDLPVDLFITDAERWGCIFALRTGPGDWNTKLVTDCKRVNRRVEGGRVLHLGKPVPTPEEADFFAALGQPWIEPSERRVDRVAIRWPA